MQITEEQVIFDIKANLKRKFEYVGGSLQITNEKLCFKPHKLNVQSKGLVILMNEIKTIDTAKILGISPNGVIINLNDNQSFKFTIGMPWENKNKEVIHYIQGLITEGNK